VSAFSDEFARVEFRFNHFQSVIHDQSARVSAISAVDKEVGAAVQLLCSLRNALVPISILPPEVLARVFHFLSLEERPCSGKQKLGWIRATHVCRFWRQVALGDSSLWARISGIPTNLELISEMLARARNTPLDIDIDLDGTPSPEVLLLMFPPHLSHTRRLRLYSL
jgi:F-box-like